jgi:acyl-CoA synthetase (NDP forming)
MLKAFFEPTSVAVIGASTNPDKLGYAVLNNLLEGDYARRGKVYPINPKAKEILGHLAYPSVLNVPYPIDLAMIMLPYLYVPDILKDCTLRPRNHQNPEKQRLSEATSTANPVDVLGDGQCPKLSLPRTRRLSLPGDGRLLENTSAPYAQVHIAAIRGATG